MSPLARTLEALLFLAPEPVPAAELAGMEPGEAAEELLARMLEARRYRRAADHLAARLAAEEGHRFRAAPLPPALRRTVLDEIAPGAYDPARLGVAIGGLLRQPPPLELGHMAMPRVSVGERLAHLRALLRGGACSFDDAVRGADRVTVAVTLFALTAGRALSTSGAAATVRP